MHQHSQKKQPCWRGPAHDTQARLSTWSMQDGHRESNLRQWLSGSCGLSGSNTTMWLTAFIVLTYNMGTWGLTPTEWAWFNVNISHLMTLLAGEGDHKDLQKVGMRLQNQQHLDWLRSHDISQNILKAAQVKLSPLFAVRHCHKSVITHTVQKLNN